MTHEAPGSLTRAQFQAPIDPSLGFEDPIEILEIQKQNRFCHRDCSGSSILKVSQVLNTARVLGIVI